MTLSKFTSLILALSLVFTLFSCSGGGGDNPEFVLTSEITEDRQNAAEEVIDTFMAAMKSRDTKSAFPLFSSGFESSEEELGEFFDKVNSLTSNPFVRFDTYYMKDLKVGDSVIKVKKSADAENYLELTPASEELYVALFASEGEDISYMMTIVLAYKDGKFEIAWVNPGDFKYGGRDAEAVFEVSEKLEKDGNLISAYISSCMLGNIMRPAGYYRYPDDDKMEDFCYRMYSTVSEKFPLPLALENTSDSSVYELGIAKDDEHGIIPLILFKTSVGIKDASAIESEAKKVIDAVEKLSPGFRQAFEYVRLNATNDSLDENTSSVSSESVTIKLH